MKQIQAMGHSLTIIFNTDKAPVKKRDKRGMDCLLLDVDGRTLAKGRSDCSYKEGKFSREVGENISLHRALERLAKIEIAKAKNQFRKGTGANRLLKAKNQPSVAVAVVESEPVAEVVVAPTIPTPAPKKKTEVSVIESVLKPKKDKVKSSSAVKTPAKKNK